jgi:hypothetical protein
MNVIRCRFDFARRTLQAEARERKLQYLLDHGREEFLKKLPQFDNELAGQLKELDRFVEIIQESNEPTVLPEGSFEILNAIAQRTFRGWDGLIHPLLTHEEVRLLSIRKGSLDQQEREEVESHVEHTYNFLKQIPWTREIRNIPEIARGHHEKMNGRGYPGNLLPKDIPLQTRLMTLADVFDALAAADRPYKVAVSVDRALEILGRMANDGEIDPQVFALFVKAKVYERWKAECFAY